LKTELDYI